MKKLSSKGTIFYKRVFPAIWFGFIALFLLTSLFAKHKQESDSVVLLVFSVFMAAIGYLVMKNLVWDLMDEAYDEGSSLLFKNHGKSVRVNLTEIKNVSYTVLVNPPRVTISLRQKTEFGDELSFSPPGILIPFKKNQDIVALIDRIDMARR